MVAVCVPCGRRCTAPRTASRKDLVLLALRAQYRRRRVQPDLRLILATRTGSRRCHNNHAPPKPPPGLDATVNCTVSPRHWYAALHRDRRNRPQQCEQDYRHVLVQAGARLRKKNARDCKKKWSVRWEFEIRFVATRGKLTRKCVLQALVDDLADCGHLIFPCVGIDRQ